MYFFAAIRISSEILKAGRIKLSGPINLKNNRADNNPVIVGI